MDNFDWVSRCVNDYEPRQFLRYTHVIDGKLVTSNGIVLMEADNNINLPEGAYLVRDRTIVNLTGSDSKFPDYGFMLPPLPKKAFLTHRIKDLPTKRIDKAGVTLLLIDNRWYQLDMLRLIVGDHHEFESFTPKNNRPLVVKPTPNDDKSRIGCVVNCKL